MRRKAQLVKRRQQSFVTTTKANQVLLPPYDALKDPYLVGYFCHPQIKKHLRRTQVIKKKHKYHAEPISEFPYNQDSFPLQGRPATERRQRKGRSFSTSVRHNPLILPSPDITDRPEIRSASNTHRKRVYNSNQSHLPLEN